MPQHITLLLTLTAALAVAGEPKSRWKLRAEKSASPVTGSRTVTIEVSPASGHNILIVGCNAGRVVFRVAQNFSTANTLYNGFTKSKIEQDTQSGPEHESYGYQLIGAPGAYQVGVKTRFEGDANFLDYTVPAAYSKGFYVALLDDSVGQFLPKLHAGQTLLVEIAEKGKGPQSSAFTADGFESVAKQALAMGCDLRGR